MLVHCKYIVGLCAATEMSFCRITLVISDKMRIYDRLDWGDIHV